MKTKNNRGNGLIICAFFAAIFLIIIFFIGAVFISEMNSIAYNIKLDMYSINKSAIIAVNKGATSRSGFSYDLKTYKNEIQKLLKANYGLNDNLESQNGLVQKVELVDYEILRKGNRDNYSNNKVKDQTLHTVLKVKIKPIFNIKILEDVCTFDIHEDVVLNELMT
jgi:hypothetical protein